MDISYKIVFFGRTDGDYLGGRMSDGRRLDRDKVRGSFFWSDGRADGGQKEKSKLCFRVAQLNSGVMKTSA